MKLDLGQCNRCMAVIYMAREAGITWTADPVAALEASEAVDALLGGRELYRIRYTGKTPADLSPARPAVLRALLGEPSSRPVVVPNHQCPPGAARRLVRPTPAQGDQTAPQRPCTSQPDPFLGALSPGPCQQCGPAPF